jgi:hypothetical protein
MNDDLACDQCEFKSGTIGNLTIHRISEHLAIKHVGKKLKNKDINLQQLEILKRKEFRCKCGYKTSFSSNFSRHNQAVHLGKKYPCEYCNYQATSKDSMTVHQRAIHEGIKYKCKDCEYQATSKGNLTKHREGIHEGKKYPCSECEYEARSKGGLNMHKQNIHEGKRF